jgi:hypothetical protein
LKYDDILVEVDPDVKLATSRLSPELIMQRCGSLGKCVDVSLYLSLSRPLNV